MAISIRQESEPSIPEGAISFGNRTGTVSQTVTTTAGEEHQCFKELPEGTYTVSVAVPAGYNPTTETDYETPLKAGDETYINFGAQGQLADPARSAGHPRSRGQALAHPGNCWRSVPAGRRGGGRICDPPVARALAGCLLAITLSPAPGIAPLNCLKTSRASIRRNACVPPC